MQKNYQRFSSEILDAASAPVRLQVLKLLASKSPLPYTEIMNQAKLDPVRDAGKFVYHLKTLRKAGLITLEKETKKYTITQLGNILVEFSRNLEEYAAAKHGRMFVRTSRMTIEEFDRTRIAKSLVTEANMPQALADEIASEAEERLQRFNTTYLTAPLIRELVNTILVERKLEEYRHKLTRLGLPVNDVTLLLREANQKHLDTEWVERTAGSAVIEEYVLLQSLNRPLADAHLSGQIHLEDIDSWVLKPSRFSHNPRPFFLKGLQGSEPPTSLESALSTILKLARTAEGHASREQVFDHFNLYLAPFVKDTPRQRIQETLKHFLYALNWNGLSNVLPAKVTLGLDSTIPNILQSQPAPSPGGRAEGVYRDFSRESEEVFRAVIDASLEISARVPLVNPSLIVKLSSERLSQPDEHLSLAHESSAKHFLPNYFIQDGNEDQTVSCEGCLFGQEDETGDASGGPMIGTVLLNLPRASYVASGKDEKLLENIRSATASALEALQLRRSSISERMKEGVLPLFSSQSNGTAYYSPSAGTAEIGLLGLSETVKHHTHSDVGEKDGIKMAEKIMDTVRKEVSEADDHRLKIKVGLHPSPEASSRLASIDAERFGFSTIVYQGAKKFPYYTDIPATPLTYKMSLTTRSSVEGEFQRVFDGGAFLPVRISPRIDPSSLSAATRQLGNAGVKSFAYTGIRSRCQLCYHLGSGIVVKCSDCGSDRLTLLGRISGSILPLDFWPEARKRDLERTVSYDLS